MPIQQKIQENSLESYSAKPHQKRIYILDLLRFISALAVVFYHYAHRPEAEYFGWFTEVTQYGYLGVPVFFTISGYVIAFSAAGRDVKSFAIARAARLYPAYWLGLMFTGIVLWYYGQFNFSALAIVTNIAMVNDLFNYSSFDGVYWTLHAELRFYACIGLLLLLGWFPKFHWWLPVWLGVTLIHTFTGQPGFLGWIISPTYSCFFISGVVYYLLHTRGASLWLTVVGITAGALCLWRAWTTVPAFIKVPELYDYWLAVMLVMASLVLFYCIVTHRCQIGRHKWVMRLGALTFPLYLIHNQVGKLWIDSLKNTFDDAVLTQTLFSQIFSHQAAVQFIAMMIITVIMLVIAWAISCLEPYAANTFKRHVTLGVNKIEAFIQSSYHNLCAVYQYVRKPSSTEITYEIEKTVDNQ